MEKVKLLTGSTSGQKTIPQAKGGVLQLSLLPLMQLVSEQNKVVEVLYIETETCTDIKAEMIEAKIKGK